MGAGYALNYHHMREMERQAYEIGNMCFRDWEDSIKQTIYFEHLQKGDKTMSTKDWKNKEIKSLLSEAWGFKMDLDQLNEGSDQNPRAGREESTGTDSTGWEEEGLQTEDSGKEEKRHYEDDDWRDKDRLDAILDHAHTLREDME